MCEARERVDDLHRPGRRVVAERRGDQRGDALVELRQEGVEFRDPAAVLDRA
jgi:hypothetical protein